MTQSKVQACPPSHGLCHEPDFLKFKMINQCQQVPFKQYRVDNAGRNTRRRKSAMSKGNARVAMRKMRNLLPPRKMIPAQSVGKHDRWSAAGALVVDLGARVLNETARNGSISDFRRLPLLRFPAGRYQHASGGEACEFREIATRNHEEVTSIVAQRVPAQGWLYVRQLPPLASKA